MNCTLSVPCWTVKEVYCTIGLVAWCLRSRLQTVQRSYYTRRRTLTALLAYSHCTVMHSVRSVQLLPGVLQYTYSPWVRIVAVTKYIGNEPYFTVGMGDIQFIYYRVQLLYLQKHSGRFVGWKNVQQSDYNVRGNKLTCAAGI